VSAATLRARAATPLREFDLDLELEVAAGAPLALVGRSGAGKTSALRLLAGLMSPREGLVELDGEVWLDTARGIDLPAERRRCGLLFQDYALFPHLSAWRNVAYGMREPRREHRRGALAMLDRFGVGALAEARPLALSGGERQRVALARALAARPRALLLDEPLSALDSTTRREALRELRALLPELDAPVVLVTHSFDDAAMLASDLAVVDGGRVVQRGSAAEISARPSSPFVADFAGAVVLRGEASAGADGLTLVRLEGSGEIHSVDPARGPVAVSVFPWEIALEPPNPPPPGSTLNRVEGEVVSVTRIGNRVRVGMSVPQPLSLEITGQSADAMDVRPGERVVAAWKATATKLIAV
jgi:molybdate transport system ATP-binding protein